MNTLSPLPLPSPTRTKSCTTTWFACRRETCAALLGAASLLAAAPACQAQSVGALTSLYSFSATDVNGLNMDGSNPASLVLSASDGNFYGVTYLGGTAGNGTIFQLTPAGQVTPLYSFTGGSDGANPFGQLTDGGDGFLYGTTTDGGGTASAGTIFKFNVATKTLTTLYTFQNASDQAFPYAALVPDGQGGFYSTTNTNGAGTLFQVTKAGVLTTLHPFNNDTDGSNPQAAPLLASDGNLYGTTLGGGANGYGTVYRYSPGTGQFSVLYSFTSGNTAYGAGVSSSLIEGPDGQLYGSASRGGDSNNDGFVFKITTGGTPTVLYQFTGGSDGSEPLGGLVVAADGNLLGTAEKGGANSTGTIFELPTTGGTPTVLYTFSAESNGVNTDGYNPNFALIPAGAGNYYAPTFRGGSGGSGTVFEFALHSAFFADEVPVGGGADYLQFPSGNYFGYYSFLSDPNFIYHFDLGYEYVFDAADGKAGVYLYDFKSSTFFYTSSSFPFPYLYDFSLNSVLYYYPDPSNAGHYNTNGIRYFYDFNTGQIITK